MSLIRQPKQQLGNLGAEIPVSDDFSNEAQAGDPDFLDTIGAAFRLDNTLVSTINNRTNRLGHGEVDQEYDPFGDIQDTKYQDFASRFSVVNNQEEGDLLKSQIDREQDDREILRQSGGLGLLTSITAGLFDPINFVPVGGAAVKAIKGGNLLKGALTTGATGLMASTASEGALMATQETRTKEEVALNIAAGTVLSGILGGGAAAISRKLGTFDKTAKALDEDMNIPADKDPDKLDTFIEEMVSDSGAEGIEDSVGAARVFDTSLEQETLIPALGTAKATAFLNPLLRMAHSQSKKVRQNSQKLIENPIFFNKNIEGIASDPAVETLIKESRGRLAQALQSNREQYSSFKKQAAGLGLKKTSLVDFNEKISMALRRNDVGENEFVTAAAKEYRAKVFDPLKKKAIELELLPKDVTVTTADSYLTRMWNRNKIIRNEPEFRDIVNQWIRSQANKAMKSFDIEVNKKVASLQSKISKAKTDASKLKLQAELKDFEVEKGVEKRSYFDTEDNLNDYVNSITDDIIATLKGQTLSTPSYELKITTRGPLKERTFNIPDSLVEQFLENDIEVIGDYYTRIMGTDVELKGKFGSTTLDEPIAEINKDYNSLVSTAKNAAERDKLEQLRKNDIRDFEAMRDIMRGSSSKYNSDPSDMWVRTGRQFRILQYTSKLGGVLVSSFADMVRPAMVHGVIRSLKTEFTPLFRGLKGIKLSVGEAKLAGQVTEKILGGRIATLAEIGDPYARGNAFERFTNNLSRVFSKATGLVHWNDFWKATSSVMTQDRVIKNIRNISEGKSLKPSERRYMAFLGYDDATMKQTGSELKKFGEKVSGVEIANTEKWGSENLRRLYRAALNKDVDRTIVTKGVGDVPLFANTEIGKLFTQFKSFAMAANQRVLISGLQQGDQAFLSGTIFAISAGMLTYYVKQIESGREITKDPAQLVIEGVDRSGLMPVFMEINNIAEKAGVPGLTRLAGEKPISRFASRNITGNFVGPTAGTLQDIASTTRATFSRDFKKSDVRALRRLTPGQNLIWARRIFDKLEGALNEKLPEK